MIDLIKFFNKLFTIKNLDYIFTDKKTGVLSWAVLDGTYKKIKLNIKNFYFFEVYFDDKNKVYYTGFDDFFN